MLTKAQIDVLQKFSDERVAAMQSCGQMIQQVFAPKLEALKQITKSN